MGQIATYYSGRTDNNVKNFWSSRQKRLAGILQTSAPSSSKPQKEVKVPALLDVPLEVPNFSSSTEEESVSKLKSCSSSHVDDSPDIQMVLPEPIFDCTPDKKQFADPHSYISFPSIPQLHREFPLQLESHEFITRQRDLDFLGVVGNSTESALGTAQLPIKPSFFGLDTCRQVAVKAESHDIVPPDIFMVGFPPTDMFDSIEPLPSPSDWSSIADSFSCRIDSWF